MTKRYGWTKDVLINHIENQSYEKYLLNQTNFDETVPEQYREQAKLAVKDQYMFDFMELSKNSLCRFRRNGGRGDLPSCGC